MILKWLYNSPNLILSQDGGVDNVIIVYTVLMVEILENH